VRQSHHQASKSSPKGPYEPDIYYLYTLYSIPAILQKSTSSFTQSP
jgi:hypothetical protein